MTDLHPHDENHPFMISRSSRRGLVLFFIYLVLYIGFLLLNVFAPAAMADKSIPLGSSLSLDLLGLNVALVYGLVLILAAIFLGFLYMQLTRPPRSS